MKSREKPFVIAECLELSTPYPDLRRRVIMIKAKNFLNLIVKSSIISFIIICIDFLILLFVAGASSNLSSNFSLIVLLEGGLCFIIGSGAVLYSPWIAKLQEITFKSKPYTASDRKQIEKQMQIVIIIGLFLVVYGLVISFF